MLSRILGIDPGLNTTGYGVLEFTGRQPRLVEAGVVRGKAGAPLAERLQEIHAGIAEIIATLQPGVLAIEELYSHYERPTTAILMGHARGVILLAAAAAGIPVQSYRATQIKKTITGNGHAAKWQMQEAIRRELNLPTLPEPPDVADALAIALCHCYLSRHQGGTHQPAPDELRNSDCGLRIAKRQSEIRNSQSEIRNPHS